MVFNVPKDGVTHTVADNFSSHHLEIESHNIEGRTNFDGRFSFSVLDEANQKIFSRWIEINTFTGQVTAMSEHMTSKDQASVVIGDVIISYLFYQAGMYGSGCRIC